ncbi:MAG TPA: SpoIIE family protein phosphatase [Bacteroidales bacterium]|jgi:sigma-B regulation protein RsbU (phosphoserine phosphatase)|nr:SpoIIE family protein phosphatase [Bacteroidales bacterium]MCZ2416190.1 SpoIIE family protein phosphatase [Burkholderiales bacterium]OQC58274.1 MAG: Phosphoserine phosphatase RsbU [Bacteroidetes bacterium ADurb.Bin013]MBP8998883.1 SpoIIE family protein phosphatase [Bacteroidales bacterium]MBV6456044.1 Regulator of RpoS [Bacteroidales bacterium]
MAAEKILVVDDETDLQYVINQKFRRQIRNDQYEFHFAFNGLEALAKLIEVPDIGVILSDINMPEMDGLTLLSKVRELKNPLLKTVICSAYGDMDNIRTAMNRGAFDFVTKPVDFNDLEITLEKTIGELNIVREGLAYHDKLLSIEHDLMVAREIQRAIMPKAIPGLEWADIDGSMEAARQIGGDFYDYFMMDDHRLGFVIGDVSGKGIPAAIFMAVSRTLIRATGLKGMSPRDCMNYVNHLLCTESVNSMFVTVFYGMLDLETDTLHYVNAGHNPPILLRHNGSTEVFPMTDNIVLGVYDGYSFKTNSIPFLKDDTLVMYTDGVTEAFNQNNEEYGFETLHTLLKEQVLGNKEVMDGKDAPARICLIIADDVNRFAGEEEQSDDITIMVVKRN